jgi:hypothetical protein
VNENRRQILEMLAAGQITAEEAERLLAALDKSETPPAGPAAESAPKPKPKYLRVLVRSDEGHNPNDPSTVNIRVPMQLLRAGVRLASLIPVQAREHINNAMRDQGVPFDIAQVKPENLEELIDTLDDLTVDVDQRNAKVRVFCE